MSQAPSLTAAASVVEAIRAHFPVLCDRDQRPDLKQIEVEADVAVPLLTWLKANTPYVQLTHFSAVDWLEDGEFQLTYLLTDPNAFHSLMISTRIDRKAATMETVAPLWPQAVTYEQEMAEMFGLSFPGSPRAGIPFVLEDWDDPPPMRRDFDTLKYAEERYGFRPGRESLDPKEVRAAFQAQEKAKREAEKAALEAAKAQEDTAAKAKEEAAATPDDAAPKGDPA